MAAPVAVPTPLPLLLLLFAEVGGRCGGDGPFPSHLGCASHCPYCLDNRHCLCLKEAEETDDFLYQPRGLIPASRSTSFALSKSKWLPGALNSAGATGNVGFF